MVKKAVMQKHWFVTPLIFHSVYTQVIHLIRRLVSVLSCLSGHLSPVLHSSTLFLSSQPTYPSCGETQCNSHGDCVTPPEGGGDLVCDCKLGYQGRFCEDKINGALRLPLILSVFCIIVGLVVVAFVVAKLKRKKKKKQRY